MSERPRRLRRTAALRDLIAETHVDPNSLVQPHFVIEDDRAEVPIAALPGISRQGIEPLLRRIERDREFGVRTVLLFAVPDAEHKDPTGSHGASAEAPAHRAVAAIKRAFGDDVTVIADVCLCTYTDHGHCGVLTAGTVDNDASLPLLAQQAVRLAEAGADVIAPSDMMDGRVRAIRAGLDAAGFVDRAILSYAAKFASSFYGPFREAAASAPKPAAGAFAVPSDRKSYQMDLRNRREAVREALLDCDEGADMVMVKPALAYLDVIRDVSEAVDRPIAAYLVSGEYAALELLAREGLAARADLVREHLYAVRRAGASILITYHARAALEHRWI